MALLFKQSQNFSVASEAKDLETRQEKKVVWAAKIAKKESVRSPVPEASASMIGKKMEFRNLPGRGSELSGRDTGRMCRGS
jgi:hypothetical protein